MKAAAVMKKMSSLFQICKRTNTDALSADISFREAVGSMQRGHVSKELFLAVKTGKIIGSQCADRAGVEAQTAGFSFKISALLIGSKPPGGKRCSSENRTKPAGGPLFGNQ